MDGEVHQLVGRDRELAELELALDRLAAGEPWFVEIVGEPGIGKSRLLGELCRRGEARGHLALDGRAAEFERDIPFGLIVDALTDYFGSLEPATLHALDENLLSELASVFPSLPRPHRSTAPADEGAQRYRLHYAIRRVLERLAKRQPMLLALDDVHWADPGSIEVMIHLLRRFRGPLLLAVSYRHVPARLLAALEGTARARSGTRLELKPLSSEEARTLMGRSIEPALAADLYRESGGNPFYFEQLARSTPSRRLRGAMEYRWRGEGAPRALIAAIQEELLTVSDDARIAVQAAAVAGDPFEPELAAAIAERETPELLPALDELLQLDFIRPTAVPRRFRFRHPIVRRAVYDGMPGGWRIGAHSRASAALAEARAPTTTRAHHVENFATVGDEQAISVLLQAARDAASRAPEIAGRWLLAAARLLPPDDEGSRRLSILAEAASALTFAGAYDEALEVLDETLGLLSADRVADRAELVAKIAFARRMSGRPLESRSLVAGNLEALVPNSPAALRLTIELALDHYWRGEFAAMYDLAQRVSVGAHGANTQLLTCWSAALCSVASSSLGRLDEGWVRFREAKAAYAVLSDEQLAQQIDVAGYLAQAASALEQTDDALECASRSLRLAEETGQTPYIPGQLVLQANALFLKGLIAEAGKAAETAVDAAVLTGNDQFIVWALWADAMVCSSAGHTGRAIASAREALVRSARVAETYFSSLSRLHLAAALQAAGDPEAARVEFGVFEAGPDQRLLDIRGGHGWELMIRIQLALGELDSAARSAAAAEARARATSLPQRTATALNAKAAVLLAQDDPATAITSALEAMSLAQTAGNRLLGAHAQALLGTAMGRAGDPGRGAAELEIAERTLFEHGALGDADAAAQELRRLGRRLPRRARTHLSGAAPGSLSAREREVAVLVAEGKKNRDVAAALFVSEKTVETHLGRIYNKLGIHSRAVLAGIVAGERDGS